MLSFFRSKPAPVSSRRTDRSFRPSLGESSGVLEQRLALSSPGAITAPVALVAPVSPKVVTTTDRLAAWNKAEAWSFISGTWSSRVSIPFLSQLASAFGRDGVKSPSMRSLDLWAVSANQVTMTPGQGTGGVIDSKASMAIQFQSTGAPQLRLDNGDGSAPMVLKATAATKHSITFRGNVALKSSESGDSAEQTVPVVVKLARTSPTSFRFDLRLSSGGVSTTLMSYQARRPTR